MAYLEVDFDPFLALDSALEAPLTNPLQLLNYIEASDAAGIGFTFREDLRNFDNISILKAMTSGRINIRVPATLPHLQKVILFRPDIITLTDHQSEDQTLEIPSKTLKEVVDSIINTQKFGVAIRIRPDIKQLKEAYQMGIDEIEIATEALAKESCEESFLKTLGEISHAIRVGNRNNLRISVRGDLDKRLVRSLREVVNLEFISVGKALLSLSLFKGFNEALKEFVEIVSY